MGDLSITPLVPPTYRKSIHFSSMFSRKKRYVGSVVSKYPHEETIAELRILRANRTISPSLREFLDDMVRSHEKLQGIKSFNTDYLGLQIDCMQAEQKLQGLLQREERYHEVLNKFRHVVCENILFRYEDYFEGKVKEVKNILRMDAWDARGRMALQKIGRPKTYYAPEVQRRLDKEAKYRQLIIFESWEEVLGSLDEEEKLIASSKDAQIQLQGPPNTWMKNLIGELAVLSRMSSYSAEFHVRQYGLRIPLITGKDEDLREESLAKLARVIDDDREWILKGNLPTCVSAQRTPLLEAIEKFQNRYFGSVKAIRDPKSCEIKWVDYKISVEQLKRREKRVEKEARERDTLEEEQEKLNKKALKLKTGWEIAEKVKGYKKGAQVYDPEAREDLLNAAAAASEARERLRAAQEEFENAEELLCKKAFLFQRFFCSSKKVS